jgi:hypothetical protein
MTAQGQSLHRQRLLMSTHFAAGLATLLLATPVVVLLNGIEPIGIGLSAAFIGLTYAILFVIYRALGDVEAGVEDNAHAAIWMPVVSGIAVILPSIVWLYAVWGASKRSNGVDAYLLLASVIVGIWVALAAGAVIQSRLMRKGAVRAAV